MNPTIEVNGVDPAGDAPPDELFYRPGDGFEVALLRQPTRHGERWQLDVWRDGERVDGRTEEEFEDGFAALCGYVGVTRPDAKGVGLRVRQPHHHPVRHRAGGVGTLRRAPGAAARRERSGRSMTLRCRLFGHAWHPERFACRRCGRVELRCLREWWEAVSEHGM